MKKINWIDKTTVVIGGVGSIWGKQYHQDKRIYDKNYCSPTIQAGKLVGMTVRKWKGK